MQEALVEGLSVITNLHEAPCKGSYEALTYIDVKIGEL